MEGRAGKKSDEDKQKSKPYGGIPSLKRKGYAGSRGIQGWTIQGNGDPKSKVKNKL